MAEQVHTYIELRQRIHDDLRIQHPEWVQSNGKSPMCDFYEARLMELLNYDAKGLSWNQRSSSNEQEWKAAKFRSTTAGSRELDGDLTQPVFMNQHSLQGPPLRTVEPSAVVAP